MNILAFTDVHGSEKSLRSIEKLAPKVDFCVCSGDISMFETNLEGLIRRLNKLKKMTYIIPGNHEDEMTLEYVCKKYPFVQNIHRKLIVHEGIVLMGYATSGFSLTDHSFERFYQKKREQWKKYNGKMRILLSHAPPFKTKLDKLGKSFVGNNSVTRFIRSFHPDMVFCGHIHENFEKKDRINQTQIINPGNKGMIITL